MTIRSKFILFTNLAVWSTGIAIIVATHFIHKGSLERHFSQSRETQALKWQAVCRESIVDENPSFVVRYAKLLEFQPEVLYAYYLGAGGRLLTSAERAAGDPSRPTALPGGPDALEVARTVIVDEEEAGRAVIGFSKEWLRSTMARALLIAFIKVLLVTVALSVITIVAAGLAADRISVRFDILKNAAGELEQGNFEVRLPMTRDELSFFSVHFNRMAERLAELDQLKDMFISTVSHDLRGPLSATQMWLDLALNVARKQGGMPDKVRQILQMIRDVMSRHGVYITNILNAAKLKAGKLQVQMQSVPVEQVLGSSEAMYGAAAREKGVHLKVQVPEGLPPVWADPEHLDHVVMNLVSNALKFTFKDGTITLAAREEDGRIEISVTDTGDGIPEKDLGELFQAFKQLGVAEQRKKKIKGTGLGLFIVKQSMDTMGGTVAVRSKVGEGTTFTLTLKRADAQARA